MGTIGINQALFVSNIFMVRLAVDKIDTTAKSWESMGENSTVFDAYVNGFEKIKVILNLYKKLAYQDLEAISSIGKEIMEMDSKMTNLWK